jgi:hypothetical protein
MMTYGAVDADRAALTVASYLARKLASIVPPRVGVMSCHANGMRKTFTPSDAKCWYWPVGGDTPVPENEPSVETLKS